MTLDQNKAIAQRFIQEVFVQQDERAADELTAPDFVPHSWPGVEPGVESLKQAQRRVSAGLEDARMTIEDVIAEGDKVVGAPHLAWPPRGRVHGDARIGQGVRHLRDPHLPDRRRQGRGALA